MFISSFDPDEMKDCAHHIMDIIKFLQYIAKKYDFYIIGGSMYFPQRQSDKFINRSYLISPEGAVVGYYDKMHIFFQNDEEHYFVPGTKAPVFHTFYGTVGIQLCFDIRFPETIRKMVKQGMKILFVPAQFPNPRKEHWLNLLKTRAIENQIYIIAANRIGRQNEELTYFGNSVIIDPYGETVVNAYEKEGVISEYIDLEFLEAYRKSFPVLNWL